MSSALIPTIFPLQRTHLSFSQPSQSKRRASIISSIHLPTVKPLPSEPQPCLRLTGLHSLQHFVLQHDWLHLLQASIQLKDVSLGLAVHAFLVKYATDVDAFHGNVLINMYSKFYMMDAAQLVFDKMPMKNTISWTTLISGYASVNELGSVLRISREMHECGEKFNEHTCSCVLHLVDDLYMGEQIHALSIKIGVGKNAFVSTSLFSMYASNGQIEAAEVVFCEMVEVDIRCLNTLILEYRRSGDSLKAILAFRFVLETGLQPNEYTFTNCLAACCASLNANEGRQVHGVAIKCGALCEISVGNAAIMMYGKHGLLDDAHKVFDGMRDRNLVSWTAILSISTKNGLKNKVIDGFISMIQMGVGFDPSCFSTVLDACSHYAGCKFISQVHAFVFKHGCASDAFVGAALSGAYSKSGGPKQARLVFNGIANPSTASFNAILDPSLSLCADEDNIMVLFNELRSVWLKPDDVTLSRFLRLSSDHSLVVHGKAFHAFGIKSGLDKDICVGNAIVSMYGKCGCIVDACNKFKEMIKRDNATWNAIIAAHAIHGQGLEVLLQFRNMIRERVKPDESTFVSILQACSYSGCLEEGIRIFQSMQEEYGIKPGIELHVCLVDLLGRMGHLEKAIEFIKQSKFRDEPQLWRCMVNACKLRGDQNIGKIASTCLIALTPEDSASYMLVANMYSEGGMLAEEAGIRVEMRRRKLRKEVGCSWVALGSQVHQFTSGAVHHPQSKEIYERLAALRCHMNEFGKE